MSFINAQSKSPTTITNIYDCTRFDSITLRVPMIRKQCLTLRRRFSEECFNFVVSSKTFKINSILNTVYVFDFNLCAKQTKLHSQKKTQIKPYLAFTHIIRTLKPANIKGFCFSSGLIVFYVTELARSFDTLS